MQRPGPAKGDQREVARIDPALDGQQADGVGHVLVGEVDDCLRRRFPGQSQRTRQRVDHRRRALRVQLQFPAQEKIGVEPAQHQVGVGHGGGVAAGAVAAGAGPGAGALRSHRQHAALVDARDGAAAGAQRAHLDHRQRHRQPPLDLVVGGELRLALQQQSHVAARAAHVEGDRLLEARLAGEVAPPITPPASPESSSSTGRSGACTSPVVPPSDLSSEQGALTRRSRSAVPMLGQ